jgi:hypothetical protein
MIIFAYGWWLRKEDICTPGNIPFDAMHDRRNGHTFFWLDEEMEVIREDDKREEVVRNHCFRNPDLLYTTPSEEHETETRSVSLRLRGDEMDCAWEVISFR